MIFTLELLRSEKRFFAYFSDLPSVGLSLVLASEFGVTKKRSNQQVESSHNDLKYPAGYECKNSAKQTLDLIV